MPRPNKVWFRRDVRWWMVTLNGEKIRLAEGRQNKRLAEQKLHELLAVRCHAAEAPTARVADIIEKFLARNRPDLSAETMRSYDWYGQAFAEYAGFHLAVDLRPHHVNDFVQSHNAWGPTTQYNARRSIFRMFAWATEEGILAVNPLRGMKRPKPMPKRRAMTEGEFRSLLKGEPKVCFKMLLFALWATGCRPKEARTLKWANVRDDRWVLEEHKTVHKTKKPRIIYLTGSMRKLMAVLRRESTSEFVFLNTHGAPWTTNALRIRIGRLKEKLELEDDLCAYLMRHAFGTNAIIRGVDVATTAALMGHTSLEMVTTVYCHLADQQQHLQSAVEKVTARRAAATPRPDAPRSVA